MERHEEVAIILLEFGALCLLERVFDRQRVKFEDLGEDTLILGRGPGHVHPERPLLARKGVGKRLGGKFTDAVADVMEDLHRCGPRCLFARQDTPPPML